VQARLCRRMCLLVALLVGGAAFVASPVRADTALVTLDEAQTVLAAGSPGQQTTLVGLTNLTNSAVTISAAVANCPVTVGGGASTMLSPAEHTLLTVGVSGSCASEQSVALAITATSGSTSQLLNVTAVATSSPQVHWKDLWSFGVAGLAAFVVVLLAYGWWALGGSGQPGQRGLLEPLALDSSWSFKDSWVTNITAASGLMVVLLGPSDFLTDVLGPDAQAAIGFSTVAGLVALALVGAAGVLALTVRKSDQNEFTSGGLLAGSVVALGAAGGQVWAVYFGLGDVSLGRGHGVLEVAAIGATALLVAYGFFSINNLLTIGTQKAPDVWASPPAVEIAAAALIAASQQGPLSRAAVEHVLTVMEPRPPSTPGRKARTPVRSALP
jgi:hypothetical protein